MKQPTGSGGKKARNKYVGAWHEPVSTRIGLPFTPDALKEVLTLGGDPDAATYTHQDIAHWCSRFNMAMLETDKNQTMSAAMEIAADVDAQWEMYLANTYSLEELQHLQFSSVRLPVGWFQDWLSRLDQIRGHCRSV